MSLFFLKKSLFTIDLLESGSKPGPSVVLVVSPRSSLNRLSLFSPPAPAPCSPWRTSPALPVQRLQALAACVLPVPSNWFLHLRYRPETLSLWFCMPSWCTRARACVCALPGCCWAPCASSHEETLEALLGRRLGSDSPYVWGEVT